MTNEELNHAIVRESDTWVSIETPGRLEWRRFGDRVRLQQQWGIQGGGRCRIEWRDVPVEGSPDAFVSLPTPESMQP